MKAIILKNPLNKINLLRNTANFFKELKENLSNKILIKKLFLTLKNGDELILVDNLECDLNNNKNVLSIKRLILHKYTKGINENIKGSAINKEFESLIFIYDEL